MVIPLKSAFLCLNCDCIQGHPGPCETCAQADLMPLSYWVPPIAALDEEPEAEEVAA